MSLVYDDIYEITRDNYGLICGYKIKVYLVILKVDVSVVLRVESL